MFPDILCLLVCIVDAIAGVIEAVDLLIEGLGSDTLGGINVHGLDRAVVE